MMGTRRSSIVPLCLLVLVALVAAASALGPIAFTGQGVIQGKWANQVQQFLGVPFAAPPVGELRFKPPVRPDAWNGVRSATEFGPNCPQNGLAGVQPLPNQSEDCLYLNIWVLIGFYLFVATCSSFRCSIVDKFV
jgi:para-nitrobenzyl esterase